MLMVSFTFSMRRHLIRHASAPFTSSHLAKFGWVPFAVCNSWQQSRTQNLWRVGEISGPIVIRLWTKVHEIFTQRRRPFTLSNALTDCLSRFMQKMFAIKSWSRRKTNKCKFFRPQFLGGTTPTFLRQIVSAIYCLPFGKVWLSSVSWSPLAKSIAMK